MSTIRVWKVMRLSTVRKMRFISGGTAIREICQTDFRRVRPNWSNWKTSNIFSNTVDVIYSYYKSHDFTFYRKTRFQAVGRRSAASIELQSVNLEIGVKLAKFQLTYQHENDISHGKWFQYDPICSRAVGKKYTVWHRPLCKQFPVSRAPARWLQISGA